MSKQKLELEVFSDIACPYCYIGKRHLERAAESLEIEVKIHWRSFLLNKDAPKQTTKDRYTFLAEKYGRGRQWAIELSQQIASQAQEVGIAFNFDSNQPSNTFDAHRLLHLAQKFDCQSALKEAFMKAYFCDGELIADHSVLTKIAVAVGLDKSAVEALLSSDQFAMQVHEDHNLAKQYQISSVPSYVFEQRYVMVGAQPIEKFTAIFSRFLVPI